jgi:predicted RNase H-like HicB family nuclease
MKTYNFPIIIEHDQDGYYVSCPDLQGCYTQGATYEEAVENIQEVIKLHIEDRDEEFDPTKSVSLATVSVAV